MSTVRSIDLDPEDWFWATWRPRSPLPKPEPAPFDLDDCLERFSKITKGPYSWSWSWNRARLAPIMSREEAHFWLVALTDVIKAKQEPRSYVPTLRAKRKTFDGRLTFGQAAKTLSEEPYPPQQHLLLLSSFLEARDVIPLLKKVHGYAEKRLFEEWVLKCFRRSVLPYLTDAEYRQMQDDVRAMLGAPAIPSDHFEGFPPEVHLAAALGLHAEVSRLVQSIPDDHYDPEVLCDYEQCPQLLVLGLGDPRGRVGNAPVEADSEGAQLRSGLDRSHRGLGAR